MKTIIANQNNIDLLIGRFQKFIKRNAQKGLSFEVKQTWGNPQKTEKWDKGPHNQRFLVTPKVGKHLNFGKNERLLSIRPQSEEDVLNIHFSGIRSWFNENYPSGIDFSKTTVNSFIVENGDKIAFKNEGILVIPKRPHHGTKQILSWMFVAS